jgi:hypothetical protein
MPLGFGPLSRRPISRLNDLPLVATMAAGVGAVVLYTLELYPVTGSAVFAATEEYKTLPTDSRPNQPFNGTLDKAMTFKRSIVDGSGFGRVASGFGEIEINNAGGEYDALAAAPLSGARALVKLAWRDISYDRAIVLYVGQVESAEIDDEIVRLRVEDDNKRLEVPVQPSLYGGAGGVDGDANVKGKRKPLCLGAPPNVTLQLIVASVLIYQIHDGRITSVSAVYDRGVALAANGTPDYADYAALAAATITPGRYATCLALGLIRLGSKPDGEVTATAQGAVSNGLVAGSSTVGTALTDTASLVHYLITISTANIIVDTGSVLTVKAAQPAPIGYFVGPDDNKTLRQVIDELMGGDQGGIGGWAGFRRDRSLELAVFGLPSAQPAGDYTQIDWYSLKRVPLPSGVEPPPYRYRAAYSLNWTIQADVDATVDAGTQTLRKDAHSIAVSTDAVTSAAVLAAYPNAARDPDVLKTFFVNSADAVAECNRRLALYGGAMRSLYRVSLPSAALAIALGGVIRLTDTSTQPRFGLAAGKALAVVEVEDLTDENEVVLEGFG